MKLPGGVHMQRACDELADAVEQLGGDRDRFVALLSRSVALLYTGARLPTDEQVADELGLEPAEVVEAFERVFLNGERT
jgi:hypothetical protein